jgi:hypothetical protein
LRRAFTLPELYSTPDDDMVRPDDEPKAAMAG